MIKQAISELWSNYEETNLFFCHGGQKLHLNAIDNLTQGFRAVSDFLCFMFTQLLVQD